MKVAIQSCVQHVSKQSHHLDAVVKMIERRISVDHKKSNQIGSNVAKSAAKTKTEIKKTVMEELEAKCIKGANDKCEHMVNSNEVCYDIEHNGESNVVKSAVETKTKNSVLTRDVEEKIENNVQSEQINIANEAGKELENVVTMDTQSQHSKPFDKNNSTKKSRENKEREERSCRGMNHNDVPQIEKETHENRNDEIDTVSAKCLASHVEGGEVIHFKMENLKVDTVDENLDWFFSEDKQKDEEFHNDTNSKEKNRNTDQFGDNVKQKENANDGFVDIDVDSGFIELSKGKDDIVKSLEELQTAIQKDVEGLRIKCKQMQSRISNRNTRKVESVDIETDSDSDFEDCVLNVEVKTNRTINNKLECEMEKRTSNLTESLINIDVLQCKLLKQHAENEIESKAVEDELNDKIIKIVDVTDRKVDLADNKTEVSDVKVDKSFDKKTLDSNKEKQADHLKNEECKTNYKGGISSLSDINNLLKDMSKNKPIASKPNLLLYRRHAVDTVDLSSKLEEHKNTDINSKADIKENEKDMVVDNCVRSDDEEAKHIYAATEFNTAIVKASVSDKTTDKLKNKYHKFPALNIESSLSQGQGVSTTRKNIMLRSRHMNETEEDDQHNVGPIHEIKKPLIESVKDKSNDNNEIGDLQKEDSTGTMSNIVPLVDYMTESKHNIIGPKDNSDNRKEIGNELPKGIKTNNKPRNISSKDKSDEIKEIGREPTRETKAENKPSNKGSRDNSDRRKGLVRELTKAAVTIEDVVDTVADVICMQSREKDLR